MKCTRPDTSAGAADRCYLEPPDGKCPADGYTSYDRTLKFGGTPGVTYNVTIHFQGIHEAGDYQGGMAEPKQFLRGATHINRALHTWLSMEVSSPAALYNPNAGAGAGSVTVYDYVATIPIDGGATIRLKANDFDCLMHRCPGNQLSGCNGVNVPGTSPPIPASDGGYMHMTVQSVVAK
jgi:hypothetical protein